MNQQVNVKNTCLFVMIVQIRMKNDEKGVWRTSTRWHPWRDSTGIRHTPVFWHNNAIHSTLNGEVLFHVQDMESLIETVCGYGLFVLCNDLLSEREFPYANELIGDSHAKPCFTEAGTIPAMRLSFKRKSGFLVPASTWQYQDIPDVSLVNIVSTIFRLFGFEATTPSSLSEKVLRATLPEHHHIYRPSVWLRRDILDNHTGGRIDKAVPAFYRFVREYDKNKAYLYHSRIVPSPFLAPVHRARIGLDELFGYPTGFWAVRMVASGILPSPIQVEGVNPVAGEVFEKWLWTGEIQDCLEAGYQFLSCEHGWGFREMSNFMEMWSDILWQKYEEAKRNENPLILKIIKQMMVGLPGRFLRKPEQFKLITWDELDKEKGDIPLMLHPIKLGDKYFSNWGIRPEYDIESTALSPQGSYIVAEMRRELYHRMKEEVEHGYKIIRSYIDCYSVSSSQGDTCNNQSRSGDRGTSNDGPDMATGYRNIGSGLGEWKEKTYRDVFAEENRFVGIDQLGQGEMKAPGLTQGQRIQFWQRYHAIVQRQHL